MKQKIFALAVIVTVGCLFDNCAKPSASGGSYSSNDTAGAIQTEAFCGDTITWGNGTAYKVYQSTLYSSTETALTDGVYGYSTPPPACHYEISNGVPTQL